MILPTKGVSPGHALLSVGADVLRLLSETKTVSRLWDDFQKARATPTEVPFDWFVLSLDLLYLLGAIDFDRGRVRKSQNLPHEGVSL